MVAYQQLQSSIRARIDASAWEWLERALDTARRSGADELLSNYTLASHRAGRTPLGDGVALTPDGAEVPLAHWTVEDAARALLLLARADDRAAADFLADARACYLRGDAREQQSWVRALPLLPDAQRLLPQAVDACRTSIQPLFEAIACENPYPAGHFPELNFNQMVLKALFNGVALSRIVGLQGRLNPEMSRMAGDYAAERRAAGRAVPADIDLAMIATDRGQELPS